MKTNRITKIVPAKTFRGRVAQLTKWLGGTSQTSGILVAGRKAHTGNRTGFWIRPMYANILLLLLEHPEVKRAATNLSRELETKVYNADRY